MQALRVLGLALLLWLPSAPAFAESITTADGHRVSADADCVGDGRRVATALATIQREVARRVASPFEGSAAHVYVVGSHKRMCEVVGSTVPAWAAGVCVGARSLIVIRSDRAHDGAPFRTLHTILRHEWVHLALYRMAATTLGPRASQALPRWFEEGLCETIGGGVSVDGGGTLELSAAANNLIAFSEIETTWPRRESRAALAYAQGKSFVEYVASDIGWRKLSLVLRHAARDKEEGGPSGRLDRALYELSSQRLSDWASRWREHTKETARPWFHLFFKDLTQTIFLALAILSAGWFFVIRVRRKRAYDELVQEEAAQAAREKIGERSQGADE